MASAVTARQALQDWLAYLENERRSSPRTVRAYGDNVSAYLAFLQQHRGGPVSAQDMAEVQAQEQQVGIVLAALEPRFDHRAP